MNKPTMFFGLGLVMGYLLAFLYYDFAIGYELKKMEKSIENIKSKESSNNRIFERQIQAIFSDQVATNTF